MLTPAGETQEVIPPPEHLQPKRLLVRRLVDTRLQSPAGKEREWQGEEAHDRPARAPKTDSDARIAAADRQKARAGTLPLGPDRRDDPDGDDGQERKQGRVAV